MSLTKTSATGFDYLAMVTALLQRARLADPDGGLWEAADFQWWWRRDQHGIERRQAFWLDEEGPVGAVCFMDWGDLLQCDLIYLDETSLEEMWACALGVISVERSDGKKIELTTRDDEPELSALAIDSGFERNEDAFSTNSMTSDLIPPLKPLPDGFRLASRSERVSEPHHMISKNGPDIGRYLEECPLYRRDLDLVVVAPSGEVAGYSLFWADPVTGVGLVEPMRTWDAFQQMGIGRQLLISGLERLKALGCTKLRVTNEVSNAAARKLYLGAGFEPTFTSRGYRL
jgi:ribosomal protein S18 acetylase RimI-like enzyme